MYTYTNIYDTYIYIYIHAYKIDRHTYVCKYVWMDRYRYRDIYIDTFFLDPSFTQAAFPDLLDLALPPHLYLYLYLFISFSL